MNNLRYDSQINLGQVINLSDGMEPSNDSLYSSKLFEGSVAEIENALKKLNSKSDTCEFYHYPSLFSCKTWTDLISTLFKNFTVEERSKNFSAAALLKKYTNEASEANKKIAENFHIPLEYAKDTPAFSYILVKIPRVLSNPATVQLSQGSRLKGKENYNNKLDLFNAEYNVMVEPKEQIERTIQFLTKEAGSHFVDSITLGDEAIQIFVYAAENFKKVCAAMDENGWSGIKSSAFRYFTSSQFCTYASPVKLLSNAPQFDKLRYLLEDSTYHLTESIFRIPTLDFNEKVDQLKKLTCIGAHLVSITKWSEPAANKVVDTEKTCAEEMIYDIGIQNCICRLGAEGAGPAAANEISAPSYAKIYEAFSKIDMLSMLWTPYLSISQMYIRLDKMWNYPALNKSGVKHLIIIADVIEIQSDIQFSNLESFTLVCRLFISGKNGSVPAIELSKTAGSPLELYCNAMIGNCLFKNSDGTIRNELVFHSAAVSMVNKNSNVIVENVFAGKFPLHVLNSVHDTTVEKWRRAALINGINTLLSSAYAILSPQGALSDQLIQAAAESRKCVHWIDEQIGKATHLQMQDDDSKEEISSIYARTAIILNRNIPPEEASSMLPAVPTLRYTAYEKAIYNLLNLAGDYTNEVNRTKNRIWIYVNTLDKKS